MKKIIEKKVSIPSADKASKSSAADASKSSVTKKTPAKKNAAKKSLVTPEEKFVAHSTSLKAGDKAPAFAANDQNGKQVTLADLKGKKIVLYFYPKDNTPTCILEACSLRDEHKYLAQKNYVVLGVSADDEKMHKKFATKFDLPFSLLADTDMAIIKAYDVWGTKKFMGRIYDGIIRTTFIINEKGMISEVITDVKSKEHGKQVLGF
jgi:peroxiredoxin Q/BCP